MSIVGISQTLGSLGDEIGRALARALSYEFADREIVLKAAEQFGEGVRELEHVTEEKPSLWERFSDTKQRYLTYVEAIIWEMAARDNVVIAGRGAPFILRDVRHALRVRVTAPEPLRARRVEQQGLLPDAAADLVRQSDRERASRVSFLYHIGWDDPLLYDLVLNTDHLDVNDAVRLLRDTLATGRFQPTPDSLTEVRDLSLVALARAALLANATTRDLPLYLSCRDGHLAVSGAVAREEHRTAAEEIVRKIAGITSVRSEIMVAPLHGAGYRPFP